MTQEQLTLLENSGVRLIDSSFKRVVYGIKNDNLIIFGGANGTLSVSIDMVRELAKEITEIAEVFK